MGVIIYSKLVSNKHIIKQFLKKMLLFHRYKDGHVEMR